jgi:hypothetical protein
MPGSTLPDELLAAGYDVQEIGEGQRILPTAIVQRFHQECGRHAGPVDRGLDAADRRDADDAGIVRVVRYNFRLPI